jgi:biopolymer transport protein ExbD
MKIKRASRMTGEVSMASTSDIAFLLIIFFMVTSSFIIKEGLHLVLPSGEKKPEIVKDQDIAKVVVKADSTITFMDKETSHEQLESDLKALIKKDAESIVLLKIEQEVPYDDTVSVIDVVKAAGVTRLSLKMLE